MSTGLWIAYAVITVVSFIYTWYTMENVDYGGSPDNASPQKLNSQGITQCSEGMVVPIVYGTVRLPGNMLWYGNYKNRPIVQKVDTGDGHDWVVTGYNYYLDMWQAVCCGNVSLISIYEKDKLAGGISYDWNNGSGSNHPTEETYMNRMPGVAHIWLEKYHLGENVTQPAILHFVVKRSLSTSPISYADMTSGNNPAAIVHDLLVQGGATLSDIDINSFNDAATEWNAKGYALNIALTGQQKVFEHCKQVLAYVGGVLIQDNEGKFKLKALKATDATVATLSDDDFLDFSLITQTWDDVYTNFTGKYTAVDQDYTARVITYQNTALLRSTGVRNQKTIDLMAFTSADIASKRLAEIAKKLSYPTSAVEFKTNLAFENIEQGDIIEITHSDYGLVSEKYRITEKSLENIDKNELKFAGIQMVEALFDSHYSIAADPLTTPLDLTPTALTNVEIIELPYTPQVGKTAAYMVLAAMNHGWESGYEIWYSVTNTDYVLYNRCYAFSQHGEIAETYIENTYNVDDDCGLLYTPSNDVPEFDSLSRTDLFWHNRVVVVGDELMGFQTLTPEGAADIRLTGVVRGLYNTAIAQHLIGADMFLSFFADNIITGIESSDFYIKIRPFAADKAVDLSAITAIHITSTARSMTPWPVSRVKAVRTGSAIAIEWWPKTPGVPGAGTSSPDTQTDIHPFVFDGDFELWVDSGTHEYIADTTKDITSAAACVFHIKHRIDGYVSSEVSLSIDTADGDYII